MSRSFVMPTQHQLSSATVIDFIIAHARGTAPQTDTQRKVARRLAELDPSRAISQRLERNFNSISPKSRTRAFGLFEPGNLDVASFAESGALKASQTMTMMKFDDVGEATVPDFPQNTAFTILFNGFYCRDSSGDRIIVGPSDEPYIVTVAVTIEAGDNKTRNELHPVGDPDKHYDGVDDGDSRHGPIAAVWSGLLPAHPISLVTVVMEHDEGDPNAFKEEIATVVGAAAAVAASFGLLVPALVIALAGLVINWLIGSADDVLGTGITVITPEGLKLKVTHPTQEIVKERLIVKPLGFGWLETELVEDHTGLQCHAEVRIKGDAEYFVAYEYSANQAPLQPPLGNRPRLRLNQGQTVIVA